MRAISSIVSALVLGAASLQPAFAQSLDYPEEVLSACELEGADEWRAAYPKPTAEEQEILNLEREACHIVVTGDIDEGLRQIIAEDGIILLDGGGIVRGREAQIALFNDYIEQGFGIVWEGVHAMVSESGDMAWAVGLVELTTPDGTVQNAKYTSVWRLIDGQWMNVVEMRNANGEADAFVLQ